MIESLKIKNVALLRNVTIDFATGFNVLMGETGAGKSIILDALNFSLGAKSDKELITTGEQNLRVEAVFSNFQKEINEELENLGIESDDKIIIVRTLNQDGKSDIKINGSSATLSMLKSISKFLADSYSQHENLVLLKPKNHLAILDAFNPSALMCEKEELTKIVNDLRNIKEQLKQIGGSGENRERLIDLLKFQVEEIENVKPTQKEEDDIVETLAIYNNSEKIILALQDATSNLDGNEFSILNSIKSAIRNLNSISNYSSVYKELNDRLLSAMYDLEDISSLLNKEKRAVSFDEKQFELLDARLDKYKILKKKYGGTVEKVLEYLQKTKLDLDNLLNAEKKLATYEKEIAILDNKALALCEKLSTKRKELAKEIEEKIKLELAELGMKNARFVCDFARKDGFDENGYDDVEFLFSANAGMDLKPLSKIISGGEMSRFSLAIKNIVKEAGACLVFDEIDSGISGEVGRAVGQRIARLSKNNQVICISHSAQVCSMADSFYLVTKQVENEKTSSKVENLSGQRVLQELAKMSSGKAISDISLAHANELIERANAFKMTC